MDEQLTAGPMTVEKQTVSQIRSHGAPTRWSGGFRLRVFAPCRTIHIAGAVLSALAAEATATTLRVAATSSAPLHTGTAASGFFLRSSAKLPIGPEIAAI